MALNLDVCNNFIRADALIFNVVLKDLWVSCHSVAGLSPLNKLLFVLSGDAWFPAVTFSFVFKPLLCPSVTFYNVSSISNLAFLV